MALNCLVFFLTKIAITPIVHVKPLIGLSTASTHGFQDETLHCAQGIVIDLCQFIIVLRVIRKQLFGFKRAGQNLTRACKPLRILYPITVWLFWSVDTQFAVNSAVTIQRFDHECAPWPMHDF